MAANAVGGDGDRGSWRAPIWTQFGAPGIWSQITAGHSHMDWMLAISATSKALEGLRLLRDVDKSFGEASFKMKIAEVTENVVDLKNSLSDARSLLAEKDAEINKLRESFAFKAERTISVRGFTYEQDSTGGAQGMPFCPRCELADGKFIRIVTQHRMHGPDIAVCPQCKANYGMQTGFTYEMDRRKPG